MAYEVRWDFIRPWVEGKRVLDVGPAELVATDNVDKFDRWIHGRVAQVAESLVGIEKNSEQVQALRDQGYEIRQGDAEQFDLDERFDVVLAGELIEHLSNPGMFLNCARRHLGEGGRLVLTTPNRYSILTLLQVLRRGEVPPYRKPIAKHVVYFDASSLADLLERHGFSDIEIDYCKWVGAPSEKRRERWLLALLSRYRPALLPVLLAVAGPHEIVCF